MEKKYKEKLRLDAHLRHNVHVSIKAGNRQDALTSEYSH